MTLQYKSRRGRPKEIKGGCSQMTFYLNADRVEDFRQLCDEFHISVSEGIRQLVEQELEKKELGTTNPIGIHFTEANKDMAINQPTLDYYLDTGFIKNDQWREQFNQQTDVVKMQKIEALTSVMHNQAKNRVYYLKTGHCLQ